MTRRSLGTRRCLLSTEFQTGYKSSRGVHKINYPSVPFLCVAPYVCESINTVHINASTMDQRFTVINECDIVLRDENNVISVHSCAVSARTEGPTRMTVSYIWRQTNVLKGIRMGLSMWRK
jgi:hypothetical protein